MGTAERHGTAGTGVAEATEARRGPQAPDHDIPADIPMRAADRESLAGAGAETGARRTRGARFVAGADAETGTETVADTEAEAEPDSKAETETGAAAVANAEAEAEYVTNAGAEAAMEAEAEAEEQGYYRQLWVEEPATRRRMPDPVRASAVRAVIIIAVTLIQAMVAFLCTLAGSWLAFPMVLSSVASTVVATWGALDVWVTRQVWNQRNGVVSVPSSTARALRRERRRARRQERASERTKERIRRQGGGAGQLSHS
ncbi:hypothetical protein OHB35_41960 [Streptomyces phaeochromogenes]|uniref:Uncharacterized protein n=1 Tax=Streptomyces phaeochromogenes TaxID=1923 RepID=A0ABZ1HTE5_STRPH|nr:hypothetical protein OHB35_41960 [Streptomyces phaeochromogenes]